MDGSWKKPLRARVHQDLRRSSRIIALMDCEIAFNGATHKAIIVNLSTNGALISSKSLPPEGSVISIHISHPNLKGPLTVDALVLSGAWVLPTNEKAGRFRVRFSSNAPELMHLHYTLSVKKGAC
jgi:hypothetical protein